MKRINPRDVSPIRPRHVAYRAPYYVVCSMPGCDDNIFAFTKEDVVVAAKDLGWHHIKGIGVVCHNCYNKLLDDGIIDAVEENE